MFWMYSRPLDTTVKYIEERFGRRNPKVAEANLAALKAGYNYGETTEIFAAHYHVPKAQVWRPASTATSPATRRRRSASSRRASWRACRCSTAATRSRPPPTSCTSSRRFKRFGVKTFQAEDEIAAIGTAIGASFGGLMGMTGTSPAPASPSRAKASASPSWLSCRWSSSTCSAPAPARASRRRRSRATCCSACSAATAWRRWPSSPRARPRLLLHGDRSLAHRDQVPHAGHLPQSDLYLGYGSEPWLHPRHQHAAEDRRRLRDRPGDLPAVRARPEDAGASMGHPRHARPRAPHRRPREGEHRRQRQLRAGEPRPDDAPARREDRAHRRRHPAARGVRRRRGRRLAGPRLGQHLRCHPHRRAARSRPGQERLARSPEVPQPDAEERRRSAEALQEGAHPGEQHGPAAAAHPRRVPGRCVKGCTASRAGRS